MLYIFNNNNNNNKKDTKYSFSPDGEKFLVDSLHAGVLTAHTECGTGVRLRHSVSPVHYIYRIVRAGGCPIVVVEHWQFNQAS